MSVSSQEYMIFVQFIPREMLQVDIAVTGSSLDSVLQATQDGDSVVVMEVTPVWLPGEVSEDGGEPFQSTYTCSGDSFTLTANDYGAWTFVRE